MSSTQQHQVALAHAAMEQALYFLDLHAPQRAIPYLEFASRQFRALEGTRENLR
ncbi:MAG TPA: hypothetical protein V6D20_10710 [Candidatus Obscuribacterales bacterium]